MSVTTDDFTTSFLHFPLLSTALWDLANSSYIGGNNFVINTVVRDMVKPCSGVKGDNSPRSGCLQGLSCLERDHQAKILQAERSSSSIVEEQLTCNASEAIPLKYEPIRQMELAANCNKVLVQRSAMMNDAAMDTWHKLTKALLLRKGCMANYVLATEFLSNKQYGCSLKHIRYAIHCFGKFITSAV